jgi:hypothetical protein
LRTIQPFAPQPPVVHRSPRFQVAIPAMQQPSPVPVPPFPAVAPPTSTTYHPRQRNMSSAMLSYPHNELTALAGPATADNLRVMVDELVANTSAITTSLGGGQHVANSYQCVGHLPKGNMFSTVSPSLHGLCSGGGLKEH